MQISDSANVWIARNAGGVWSEAEAWRVESNPSLRLGERTGPDELLFHGLVDAARAPGGRIAALDRGSREVRIFSAQGRFVASFGREGEGPGEFRDPARLEWLPGDSMLVWDQWLARVSVFDGDGALARSITLPSVVGPPPRPTEAVLHRRILASLDGYQAGTLIARGGLWIEQAHLQRWAVAHSELLNVALNGSSTQSLGYYPIRDVYVNDQGEQPVHFGSRSGIAVYDGRLYFADARSPRIRIHERLSGNLIGLIEAPVEAEAVTHGDLEDLKAEALVRIGGSREGAAVTASRWRALLDEIPARDSMPVFSNLLTDKAGNVWTELYRSPGRAHQGWLVFRQDGQLLGRVALPHADRIFEIGDDWILVRERDHDDVERLALYNLHKPDS